jgi:glutathione S-transferase
MLSSHNSSILLFLCLLTFTESFASKPSFTMSPPSIKLTYFDIEGAAEPIRLALVLAGVDFEDERLAFSDWPAMKPSTPYGQVPLMTIDGAASPRTQSGAMLRYVGSELSTTLYPKDKLFDIEEAVGVFDELDKSWMPSFYMGMKPANFGYPEGFQNTDEGKKVIQAMRTAWVQNVLPTHLTYLVNLLERHDNKWLASTDHPTIADCKAVVFLRSLTRGHIDHVPANCLETHPKIIEYLKRFCALEPVKGRYNNGIF